MSAEPKPEVAVAKANRHCASTQKLYTPRKRVSNRIGARWHLFVVVVVVNLNPNPSLNLDRDLARDCSQQRSSNDVSHRLAMNI